MTHKADEERPERVLRERIQIHPLNHVLLFIKFKFKMMFIFYNTQFIMVIVLITFILKMSPIKRKKYILTNH